MVEDSSPVRVVTLGQVDHGKSTLVGRLLLDTGTLPEGKLADLEAMAKRRGLDLELAFAVDALRAERDQGITIDAAHVWLRTPSRSCVIVDAPGHEEFLKNMVTGAASADAALLLIDAREGIGEQSRRHALVVQILGLDQVAVVVNKMDLVGHDEAVFRKIEADFGAFLRGTGVEGARFLPVAARTGANVVRRPTDEMPWYRGPTVLEALDGFVARPSPEAAPLRFPIQDVYKFDDRRILAGQIESGTLCVGDRLVFSPWNKIGFVKTIERWNAPPTNRATAGESIGITLESQVFVERGQVASHVQDAPLETDAFEARIFWLGRDELTPGKDYRLKLTTQETACRIEKVHRVLDVASLKEVAASSVGRNGIAEVTIQTRSPIALDEHRKLGPTGRFVLVDGYEISGGGIVSIGLHRDQRPALSGLKSDNITFTPGKISRKQRARRTGHRGRVIWFTGLSASGKSTISVALERELFEQGYFTYRLDGDNIRHGLSANLGFSEDDRAENVRRVGEVARLFCDAGIIAIVALISPRAAERDRIRASMRKGEFVEVYTDCPLATCEERDPKGLYRAAREGRIKAFTGIDAPYDVPAAPELVLRTGEWSVQACVDRVRGLLRALEASPSVGEEDP